MSLSAYTKALVASPARAMMAMLENFMVSISTETILLVVVKQDHLTFEIWCYNFCESIGPDYQSFHDTVYSALRGGKNTPDMFPS